MWGYVCKKAREVILSLQEGEYVIVSDSMLNAGCADTCKDMHNVQYVARLEGKLVVVDDGYTHHKVLLDRLSAGVHSIEEEVTEEEATEMLVDYFVRLIKRDKLTRTELENYTKDSDIAERKMSLCKEHNIEGRSIVYFEDEGCPDCEGRKIVIEF